MDKWRDSLEEIAFEGKESVLAEIMRQEESGFHFWSTFKHFMNREIEIPVAAAMSACVILVMLGVSVVPTDKETAYTYSITVVDQWGHYETY